MKRKAKRKSNKSKNPLMPYAKSALKSGRFVKVKAVRLRRQGRNLVLDYRQ